MVDVVQVRFPANPPRFSGLVRLTCPSVRPVLCPSVVRLTGLEIRRSWWDNSYPHNESGKGKEIFEEDMDKDV